MASRSNKTASLPSSRTVRMLATAAGSLASATTIPEYRWPQTPEHNRMVPLYMRAPSPPSSTATAVSVSKGLLKATSDCSDMFPPLKTALTGLLVVWDLFDCTSDVQADFMELASKLEPVGTIAANYQELGGHNLQERLTAISIAVNDLVSAIEAKTSRGIFARAAQSEGDVAVVKTMFRRVSSLLEVFQFEGQIRTENMLDEIITRLNMENCASTANDESPRYIESVTNNNCNRSEIEAPAEVENHNPNETQLEIDGLGGGVVVNNNSNFSRVIAGGVCSDGIASAGVSRIINNNGNKTTVIRSAGVKRMTPGAITMQS